MSYNLGTAEGVITTSYNGRGVDEANKDMDGLTKRSMGTSEALDKVGNTSGVAGLAIAAGIGVAVKAAADFESRMSAVKAVSGASAAEMDQLTKKALQLGKDTSFSATEAAQAIEELVKSGVSVPDVMNGAADAVVALAAAGEVSLPEAAAIASNAMNQFNLSAQDMPKIADLIAGAANASAIDVGEFGMSLSQAGAVANLVGASFQDTAAAIALMGNAGIKGSDAGTSLKTMLQNLNPKTKAQVTLMKELGLMTKDGANQFFDAQGKLKSFSEIAGLLQGSLKGMTSAQKTATLETLFGSDAIRAAAIFANQGATGFDKMAGSMTKIKAADVAKTRMDNFKGSLDAFMGSLETTGIIIGQIFLPMLRKLVDFLASVANAFLELPTGVQKTIVVIIAVIGAALLMVAATVKIVKAVQTVIEVLKVLRLAMASTWVAALGPIALVIAAIALLVAGIIYAWKHSETFRNIVLGVWSAIKSAASAVLNWFTGTLWPGMQAVWNGIVSGLNAVKGFFVSVWNSIVSVVNTVVSAIASVISTYVNIWRSIITTVVNAILKLWRDFWNTFGGVITAGLNLVKALWNLGFTLMLTHARTVWNGILTVIKTVWRAISNEIQAKVNLVKSIVTTAWNVVKSLTTSAWNAVRSATTSAWNTVYNAVSGPINRVRSIVASVLNAIRGAIQSAWNSVKSATVSAWNGLVGAVSGPLNNVLSKVSGIVGRIRGVFSGAAGWLYSAGQNIIRGLLNGIESLINSVTSKLEWLTNKIPKVKGPEQRDKALLRPAGKWIMEGFIDELDKGIIKSLATLSNATDMIPDTITARSVADVMPATGLSSAASAAMTGSVAVPGKSTILNLAVTNPVGEPTEETLSKQATRLATLDVL